LRQRRQLVITHEQRCKAHPTALLARKMRQGEEGWKAMADYENGKAAALRRTASLRTLRWRLLGMHKKPWE